MNETATAAGDQSLAEAVLEMRDLQKHYFRTRDRGILILSKNAERRVDAMVKKLLTQKPKWGGCS